MGTGGATALLSPEIYAESFGANFWCVIRDWRFVIRISLLPIHDSRFSYYDLRFHCQRTTGSLKSTYRKSRSNFFKLRFVLRSFVSSVCHRPAAAGRRVNRKGKDQAERVISISQLNTLLCLHRRPINVVVYHDPSGRSHLGIGLALRCFQRLSFPNIATQHCS